MTQEPTITVLQHVPHEGVGLLGPVCEAWGCALRVIPLYDGACVPDRLPPAGALLVMGGPMNVDETASFPFLADERRLLAQAIGQDYPVLGICLGAQLIARAAGARVMRGAQKEIGYGTVRLTAAAQSDPVYAGIDSEVTVLQWHGDTFDLPAGAVHLAMSNRYPNQAFRLGRHVYGMQFHVETTPAMVESWLRINADEVAAEPAIDPERIRADAAVVAPHLERLAASCGRAWLRLAFPVHALPHGAQA